MTEENQDLKNSTNSDEVTKVDPNQVEIITNDNQERDRTKINDQKEVLSAETQAKIADLTAKSKDGLVALKNESQEVLQENIIPKGKEYFEQAVKKYDDRLIKIIYLVIYGILLFTIFFTYKASSGARNATYAELIERIQNIDLGLTMLNVVAGLLIVAIAYAYFSGKKKNMKFANIQNNIGIFVAGAIIFTNLVTSEYRHTVKEIKAILTENLSFNNIYRALHLIEQDHTMSTQGHLLGLMLQMFGGVSIVMIIYLGYKLYKMQKK
ncbi:hypothetical protein [Ligilactobacillus ceti]|uniref:Uncharacterized protein n=1 Tax=Ligilactobacillus ceti DSM 22408 TaxID=1122146 RepID=A0A0R2KTH3_9LACO|nr:hypothetical protein [Ligilactobacillus ceti]KRN89978.1 hypothetical protein IV53_GL001096 [Ligilactobacillus ceti DSM 22408]